MIGTDSLLWWLNNAMPEWCDAAMRARNISKGQGSQIKFEKFKLFLHVQPIPTRSGPFIVHDIHGPLRSLNKCETVTTSFMTHELTPKVCMVTSCCGAFSTLYLVMYLLCHF